MHGAGITALSFNSIDPSSPPAHLMHLSSYFIDKWWAVPPSPNFTTTTICSTLTHFLIAPFHSASSSHHYISTVSTPTPFTARLGLPLLSYLFLRRAFQHLPTNNLLLTYFHSTNQKSEPYIKDPELDNCFARSILPS